MSFPINSVNEREYPADWQGEVFICDIDRTYLYTKFSTLKGLASIPFEFAIDKKDIEGMVPLLREVRRGPQADSRSTPLYFISASPAQLRSVIQRKMLLDGLEFDGTTFKDWIGVLTSLKLKRLKEQLGYKLTALLKQRHELPRGAQQILIGDDLESDPLVFALFADALSGRLTEKLLMRVLLRHGVVFNDVKTICQIVKALPRSEAVKRAYIRLERYSSPEALIEYWPHIVACLGPFQIALGLWVGGSISLEGVVRVAKDLRERRQSSTELDNRIKEAVARSLVDQERGDQIRALLADHNLITPEGALPSLDPLWCRSGERQTDRPWTPQQHLRED